MAQQAMVQNRALPKLRPGDTIGILPFAFPCVADRLQSGVRFLEKLGFRVRVPLNCLTSAHRLGELFATAPAVERARALHELFADPEVKAVMASRGGYGSSEMLPVLDFAKLSAAPKALIGYSDITALLNAVTRRSGFITLHGPMAASTCASAASGDPAAEKSIEALLSLLSGRSDGELFPEPLTELRGGEGEGPLIGGNLITLLTLLSTPWEPSFDGSVLFLEDVNEKLFRIHRALLQLKLTGKLQRLAGVILGEFRPVEGDTPDLSLEMVAADIFGSGVPAYPVLLNAPFAHGECCYPLPIGARVRVARGRVRLLEQIVA